jgi:hypothetical protein
VVELWSEVAGLIGRAPHRARVIQATLGLDPPVVADRFKNYELVEIAAAAMLEASNAVGEFDVYVTDGGTGTWRLLAEAMWSARDDDFQAVRAAATERPIAFTPWQRGVLAHEDAFEDYWWLADMKARLLVTPDAVAKVVRLAKARIAGLADVGPTDDDALEFLRSLIAQKDGFISQENGAIALAERYPGFDRGRGRRLTKVLTGNKKRGPRPRLLGSAK